MKARAFQPHEKVNQLLQAVQPDYNGSFGLLPTT